MSKPKRLWLKLVCIAGFFLLFGIWYAFSLPCLFQALLGFPCPGCGMSRAWFSALRLDFGSAFRYHPMFWCVPILFGLFVFDAQLLTGKRANNLLIGILAAGILLTYLARIFGFLGGLPPV